MNRGMALPASGCDRPGRTARRRKALSWNADAQTEITDQKKEAQQFIDYSRTEESHQIFQKWGWK